MTLLKWKSKEPALPRTFSRYFEDMFDNDFFGNGLNSDLPSVNIAETNDAFRLEVAAPGFKKSDFDMAVENDVLTISGNVKQEDEKKDENYTRREFRYSSFQRSFTLPESVNTDKISAKYDDGILTINLPKKEEVKGKGRKSIKIS